jgi:hypothetical protein
MRQVLLGALTSVVLFGQPPVGRPEFEVASIKPSPPDEFNRVGSGMHIDGSQVSYRFFSLVEYIVVAYRVKRIRFPVRTGWRRSGSISRPSYRPAARLRIFG